MEITCNGEILIKFSISEKVGETKNVYNNEEIKNNIIEFIKEELQNSLNITEIELVNCEIIKKL